MQKEKWEEEYETVIFPQTLDILYDYAAGSGGKADLVKEELKAFIRSQREQAKREGVEMATKEIIKEYGGYNDGCGC